jgi:hypothetical protein
MLAYLADSRLGIGPFVRPIKASVPPHKTVTIHSELDSLMNIHPSQQSLCLIFLTVWKSLSFHTGIPRWEEGACSHDRGGHTG